MDVGCKLKEPQPDYRTCVMGGKPAEKDEGRGMTLEGAAFPAESPAIKKLRPIRTEKRGEASWK